MIRVPEEYARLQNVVYGLREISKPGAIRYVGMTSRRLVDRIADHCREYKHPDRAHWPVSRWKAKVGLDSIECVVLGVYESEAEALAGEVEIIAQMRSAGMANLNCTLGGEGTFGFSQSRESIEKGAEKRRGRSPSPETRDKISKANRGRVVSGETRAKLSASKKGKVPNLSPETRAAMKATLVERNTGESNSQSKLTSEIVEQIYIARLSGERYTSIAARYDLSIGTVRNICIGRAWAHLGLVEKHGPCPPPQRGGIWA